MADNNPLGYAPDLGVQDLKVGIDYRVENRINHAGPSPSAVYGPGNWFTILSSTLYDTAGKTVETPDHSVDIAFGSLAKNQDLPGLAVGGLDLWPIQIRVTNRVASSALTNLEFASLTVDFTVTNPSACTFNPAGVVKTLITQGYGTTENILVPSNGTPQTVNPSTAYYAFPTIDGTQAQPTIVKLTPQQVQTLYLNKTGQLNHPVLFNAEPSVFRLTIPNQLSAPATITTIQVKPDWQNYIATPTINPPFIIGVTAIGKY